jgi:hypothetical protein
MRFSSSKQNLACSPRRNSNVSHNSCINYCTPPFSPDPPSVATALWSLVSGIAFVLRNRRRLSPIGILGFPEKETSFRVWVLSRCLNFVALTCPFQEPGDCTVSYTRRTSQPAKSVELGVRGDLISPWVVGRTASYGSSKSVQAIIPGSCTAGRDRWKPPLFRNQPSSFANCVPGHKR